MRMPARPLGVVGAIAAARLGRVAPLKVTHLLTYACNEACSFCTRIHVPSGHMKEEQVATMMGAFAKMGTRYWVFNGGEPTLVKELPRYVRLAAELDFHRTLVSNGTYLEERADELSELDLVICSLHGDEAEHDRVVGLRGAWRRSIAGLKAMAARGVEICIMCVLNERNRGLLSGMLDLGEGLGASVAFQPIVETRLGGAHGDPALLPRREAMREAVDWLLAQKIEGRPVSCSRSYLEAVGASWPDKPFGVPCWAGKLFCEVTPEGFVVACCSEEEYNFARCHGPTVGWEQALLALPDRGGCQACWFKGPQELNLLLGMRPKESLRAAANLARGRILWD